MAQPPTSIWKQITSHPRLGLLILAYIAFIALGMPDGLLGVAWPGIQQSFSIPLDAVGWLLTASVAGYLTSTFLSGPLIARWGVGHLLAASCALTGAGLIGYTLAPAWWVMAALGMAAGLGAGAIDAALNTYAAAHFSAGTMQWMHACYGIGVTLGPIIMTAALTRFDSWRLGYAIVGVTQFALAACFALTLNMWERPEPPPPDAGQPPTAPEAALPKKLTDYQTPLAATLLEPRVWLSGLLFFLAVGVEGSTGIWSYTQLVESRGIDPHLAGLYVGFYWAMFTAGRIIAGLAARRVGLDRLVMIGLLLIVAGAAIWWWHPLEAANFVGIGLIGWGVAPIFPGLMSGTSARVGDRFAANTIGVQMAGAGLGNAILPSSVGALAQTTSLEAIPACVLVMGSGLLVLYPLAVRWGRAR